MKNLPLRLIALTFMLSSCNNDDEITLPQETQGYNMLLIGNSFFKPYANNLNKVALDAGFEEQMQHLFLEVVIMEDLLIFGTTQTVQLTKKLKPH